MKFPSLSYLKEQIIASAKRFPLSLFSSLVGVIVALYLLENEGSIDNPLPYINAMLTAALGIPLFFCIKVFAEKRQLTNTTLWIFSGVSLLLLVLLYFTLPSSEDGSAIALPYIRYAIYNACIHLMVSFAPFSNRGEINGFWQYNKMLFIRILTSALYSGVLFIGLTLAVVAINELFAADISDKIFGRLFITIAGLFNTWFFLSGIPKDINEFENDHQYPRGLKVFAQYILLSLLSVYLVILYAYTAKIILLWDWPIGIVSYLIICVAVVGVLTLLLIYPYGNEASSSWIKTFSKTYYFLLMPLIVVLFLAVAMRIGDYGLTINRYLVTFLGGWLALISFYFIIGRTNIKVIPISLAVLIVLISFGPWGMFSMSENSQLQRLETILTEAGILENGKITQEASWVVTESEGYVLEFSPRGSNEDILSDSLHNEVKSILDYLDDFHGFEAIAPWVSQDISAKVATYNQGKNKYQNVNEAKVYMEIMGLEYRKIRLARETNNRYVYFNLEQPTPSLTITGYDYLKSINMYRNDNQKTKSLTINNQTYSVSLDNTELTLTDSINQILQFDLSSFKEIHDKSLEYSHMLSSEEMTIVAASEKLKGKLVLESLELRRNNEAIEIHNLSGYLLLSNDH